MESEVSSKGHQRKSSMLGKVAPYRTLITSTHNCTSNPSEVTDQGRKTMLDLGRRIRNLYINQTGFLPDVLNDLNLIYLRTTPLPRTLTSLQQVVAGLYPEAKRVEALPPFEITTRRPTDETLAPNEPHCERFIQLFKAFSRRTAERCKLTSG